MQVADWLLRCWHQVLGIPAWLVALWQHLTPAEQLATVLAVVGLVIGLLGLPGTIFAFLNWIEARRAGKRTRTQVIEGENIVQYFEAKDLKTDPDLAVRQTDKLEPYVTRECIRNAFGPHLVPTQRRILFCGKSGTGKTREAIELIERLAHLQRRSIYLSRRAIPSPIDLPRVVGRGPIL